MGMLLPVFLQTTSDFSRGLYHGLRETPEALLENYYNFYPNDLINIPEDLKTILFQHSLTKRGRSMLEIALKEGYLTEGNVDAINEITLLIWQGMFTNLLNNRKSYDAEQATEIVMKYITEIVRNANLLMSKINTSNDNHASNITFPLFNRLVCMKKMISTTEKATLQGEGLISVLQSVFTFSY